MEGSARGSFGEDILALQEGDRYLFLEDIFAMMVLGAVTVPKASPPPCALFPNQPLWALDLLPPLVLHSPCVCFYPVPPLHILLLPEPLAWAHASLTSMEAGTPWQVRSGCHGHIAMTTCRDLLEKISAEGNSRIVCYMFVSLSSDLYLLDHFS